MQLCDSIDCTGCAACFNSCAHDAILMIADREGFLHPEINEANCVNCGMCRRSCPVINGVRDNHYFKNVFACWTKDSLLRKESTSGGAFTELAKCVIKNSGIVFGAALLENRVVRHIKVDTIEGLGKLRGSKYVQSEVSTTYKDVKTCLTRGRQVLYVGTPCQIAGLYAFLGERFVGMLFTIDLVCHGVPSPLVFSRYVEWLEQKFNGVLTEINFRHKHPDWYWYSMSARFSTGSVYRCQNWADPYSRGFLRDYFNRPSCHKCLFANTNRIADITLSDFWGYESKSREDRDDGKGISMCMVNSDNGKNLFRAACNNMVCFPRTVQDASRCNPALSRSFQASHQRKSFWDDFNSGVSFGQLIEKYLQPEPVPLFYRLRVSASLRYYYKFRRLVSRVLSCLTHGAC